MSDATANIGAAIDRMVSPEGSAARNAFFSGQEHQALPREAMQGNATRAQVHCRKRVVSALRVSGYGILAAVQGADERAPSSGWRPMRRDANVCTLV
jgi:hypothetical protein